jgi:site-specific recombinase XerD
MTGRVLTFRVEKESNLGARSLLRLLPGHLSPDSDLAPVAIYLDTLADSGARSQRANLERAARLLGGSSGLDYKWRALRSSHVELLRARLKSEGYAPSSINATLSAVRGVARWAWHLDQMDERAHARLKDVRMVKASDERRRPARALSAQEIASLFESCENAESICATRDACLLALLYGGGLRRDEACQLSLSAYARRTHTLIVHGKGDKQRNVWFDSGGARRAINAWLRVRGDSPGALLCPVTRHGRIIFRHLSTNGLYRALARRAEKCGIEHFTPHDLRRTFGTHLMDEGADIDLVRQLYGHVEITTTQRYIMRGEKRKRETAMKLHVPFRTRVGKGRRRKKKRRRG